MRRKANGKRVVLALLLAVLALSFAAVAIKRTMLESASDEAKAAEAGEPEGPAGGSR